MYQVIKKITFFYREIHESKSSIAYLRDGKAQIVKTTVSF